jgi:hypothetical protein
LRRLLPSKRPWFERGLFQRKPPGSLQFWRGLAVAQNPGCPCGTISSVVRSCKAHHLRGAGAGLGRRTLQTTVNPHRFIGQDMTLAPLARGQSVVLVAGFRVGRVSHTIGPDGQSRWMWTLTGPHCCTAPDGLCMCGATRTLGEAKLHLREVFDSWLRWALEQAGPVYWHWTEAPPAGMRTDANEARLPAGC